MASLTASPSELPTPAPPTGASFGLQQASAPADLAPLVAINGAWAEPERVTDWVLTLSSFAPQFPLPDATREDWRDFLRETLVWPAAIVAVGVLFAVFLPWVLHRCHPRLRSSSGGPPWTTFICACCMTCSCLVVVMILAAKSSSESFSVAVRELQRASLDATTASKLSLALNISGNAVVEDLTRLNTECPASVQQYVGDSVDNIVSEVTGYLTQVRRFSGALQELPGEIQTFAKHTRVAAFAVICCHGFPCVLVLACCIAIGIAVSKTEHSGGALARRCARCDLHCLSIFFFAPAILFLSMVAASEFALGIWSSAFCLDSDQTSLLYVESAFGEGTDEYDMTKYYLTGNGPNPALQHLHKAQGSMDEAITWVRHYGDVIAQSCPQWGKEGPTVLNLQTVQRSMNETQALLAPGHVYDYYQDAVQDTVCGSMPRGLAWTAMFQALLSLICLPLLVCTASCTVDGLIEERSWLHGIHKFELLAQEEIEEKVEYVKDQIEHMTQSSGRKSWWRPWR